MASSTTSLTRPAVNAQSRPKRRAKANKIRSRERKFRDQPSFLWSHLMAGLSIQATAAANKNGAKRESSHGPKRARAKRNTDTRTSRMPRRSQSRPRSGQESSFKSGSPFLILIPMAEKRGPMGHAFLIIPRFSLRRSCPCRRPGGDGGGKDLPVAGRSGRPACVRAVCLLPGGARPAAEAWPRSGP